jgi:hypothetical protein
MRALLAIAGATGIIFVLLAAPLTAKAQQGVPVTARQVYLRVYAECAQHIGLAPGTTTETLEQNAERVATCAQSITSAVMACVNGNATVCAMLHGLTK